ncbi:hypothetical protein [Microscilla marina]|uniref:Uncharacterized protein n=1 Tax=Microscilla marina ATCC 23134 TaxID=313606 RepID=A1ZZT6_MICM2|nr:hypothetical protein [Microscilla marina]EAY24097.1 hypothetical protein M23134_02473 [Microscilla marina ATCC 23134]
MQGKNHSLNSQTTPLQNEAKAQLNALTEGLRYSLQRRLEDIIALSQEALTSLQDPTNALPTHQIEHQWILMEDNVRLAQNDWALLEWLVV